MKTRGRAYRSPPKVIKPSKLKSASSPTQALNSLTEKRNEKNDETSPERLKEKLEKLYTDVRSVPNYSAKIADFLRLNHVHSTHRRVIKRRNFPRRRVIARFPFEIFMADLIEYLPFKRVNNGYCFILVVIDCFTKVVYTAPIKSKNMEDCFVAFDSIFDKLNRFPINMVTDQGKEFYNFKIQSLFIAHGVNHYSTPTVSPNKASMVERVIRTLKTRLQKRFATIGKSRWIDDLDQIVDNYNKTPHRSIGMAPLGVTDENRDQVYNRLYPDRKLTVVCRLKQGDKVRTVLEKSIFEKGYKQSWTSEIFIIDKVKQSNGVCWYNLKTLDNNPLKGVYYYHQLNLVSSNVD